MAFHVWRFLSEDCFPHDFLVGDMKVWLEINLRDNSQRQGGCWSLIFGVTLLCLWHVRNHLGEFILGFASHIGLCSITEAELLAILVGTKVIRVQGFSRVMMEIVKLINVGCLAQHPSYNLVKEIQDLMQLFIP